MFMGFAFQSSIVRTPSSLRSHRITNCQVNHSGTNVKLVCRATATSTGVICPLWSLSSSCSMHSNTAARVLLHPGGIAPHVTDAHASRNRNRIEDIV